jgi:hypothetical protein
VLAGLPPKALFSIASHDYLSVRIVVGFGVGPVFNEEVSFPNKDATMFIHVWKAIAIGTKGRFHGSQRNSNILATPP